MPWHSTSVSKEFVSICSVGYETQKCPLADPHTALQVTEAARAALHPQGHIPAGLNPLPGQGCKAPAARDFLVLFSAAFMQRALGPLLECQGNRESSK